jgi:hypothetical protein
MTCTTSRLSLPIGAALIAGLTMLAGCASTGPAPYTQTTTTERSTTTIPQPVTSTTTTTVDQQNTRP